MRTNRYMKKKKKCETMPKYVKIYLEKIEELCEKNNAQLLLVSMPSPKNWNHKRHAEMQQYADEKGIAYLDLNEKVEELGLNWAEDTQDKGGSPECLWGREGDFISWKLFRR